MSKIDYDQLEIEFLGFLDELDVTDPSPKQNTATLHGEGELAIHVHTKSSYTLQDSQDAFKDKFYCIKCGEWMS